MEDRAIKIATFLRELTKTKGGILILGIIIGLSPCVYVIHFQHLRIKEMEIEQKENKELVKTDIDDCAEKLLKVQEYLTKLKNM